MANNPTVSVLVTTYNHQDYIEENLDGILSQKTDFDIEILVHDDASTDDSQKIIKKYEQKYPEIIKPVYQMENQYSKGVRISDLNSKRAVGEYIAACEGDDFWIDDRKLQIQVDYMREHPECALCCHAAKKYSEAVKSFAGEVRPYGHDCLLSAEELIEQGGGYIAYNSILFRTKHNLVKPDYVYSSGVSDYPLMFFLADCGTVYYMEKEMSAYRVSVPASWNARNKSVEKREAHIARINSMLREADAYHEGKYHASFEKRILKNNFELAYLKKDWDEMLKKKYSEVFREAFGESQAKLKIRMRLRRIVGKKQ